MVHIASFGSVSAPKIEKISFLESLATYHLENRKNFHLSQNLTKLFWVTRFRETNLTAQSVSLSEI